ncbi:MAG: hypothetical protein QOI80_1108, partial [Solirubrobacteraceae bacterium]|nr:hypothetical protein [Solirubrobacteraceae bacterium]
MTDTTTTPEPEAAETDAAAPPHPSRRRRFVGWLRDRDKLEVAIWVGLILLAFVLRLWDVGSRPFHHDESQDAYFSFTFSKD